MEQGLLFASENYSKVSPSAKRRSTEIEKRLDICKECPLLILETMTCNPGLWLNPETNKVSSKPKSGYIKGCGCSIPHKIKNETSHCHLGKW